MSKFLSRYTTAQRVTLGFMLAVAVVAIVVTIRFRLRPPAALDWRGPQVFPAVRAFRPSGWTVVEQPLSETETGRSMVERILRYDDYYFASYRRGEREFSLYVAYWKSRKVDIRVVNAHTPDTCWIASGWSPCGDAIPLSGAIPGGRAKLGRARDYAKDGVLQHVVFWHLVGGEPVEMWRNGFPTFGYMWRMLTSDRQQLASEQFFVRIASNAPWSEIWSDPALQELLRRLGPTGLATSQ